MTLDLPLLKDDEYFSTQSDICLACGGKTGEDQFSIQGGALSVSEKFDGLRGFPSMVAIQDRDGKRHVFDSNIVDGLVGGQFVIFWCSVQCMRTSLNELVDQLESQTFD